MVGWVWLGAAGEVEAGFAESFEEAVGALEVDVAAGDAAEEVVEGDVDGGAVVDAGHGEGAGAAGDGFLAAGAGVVVAELGSAEGGGVAAVAEGVDVAAEVAALGVYFGFGEWLGLLVHGGHLGKKQGVLWG